MFGTTTHNCGPFEPQASSRAMNWWTLPSDVFAPWMQPQGHCNHTHSNPPCFHHRHQCPFDSVSCPFAKTCQGKVHPQNQKTLPLSEDCFPTLPWVEPALPWAKRTRMLAGFVLCTNPLCWICALLLCSLLDLCWAKVKQRLATNGLQHDHPFGVKAMQTQQAQTQAHFSISSRMFYGTSSILEATSTTIPMMEMHNKWECTKTQAAHSTTTI